MFMVAGCRTGFEFNPLYFNNYQTARVAVSYPRVHLS